MEARQRYRLLGVVLIAGGAAVGAMAWFVLDYKPLVALGISGLILGAVSMALARSLSRLSGDASLLMLRAGLDNVSALVEELGLREKALYLPTSLTQGRARALICFHTDSSRPVLSRELDRRLIVSYGPGPEDYGILVSTPGSGVLELVESPEGASTAELEATLSAALVGALDLADSVRVGQVDERITVEISRPVLGKESHPSYAVLGSPVASIAATLVAEGLGRAVSVISESPDGRWHRVELQVEPKVVQ